MVRIRGCDELWMPTVTSATGLGYDLYETRLQSSFEKEHNSLLFGLLEGRTVICLPSIGDG